MAEPRDLPLGKIPAVGLHLRNRFFQSNPTFQVGKHLFVAERLSRLPANRWVELRQRPRLVNQAGREHVVNPTVDAIIKYWAREVQPQNRGEGWRRKDER